MKRIALTGKLRSGKTTVAEYLEEIHEYKRLAFGNALKHYAHEIFGETGAKPRELYQAFGQKMREINPNIWLDVLARDVENIERTLGEDTALVIEDLRQPNEFDWARKNGFKIVRINAKEDTRLERARAAGDDFIEDNLRHETELSIDSFRADFDFWNDEEADRKKIFDTLTAHILMSEADGDD